METIESADTAPKPKSFFAQIASIARFIEEAREAEGGSKIDFIALKRLNAKADELTSQEIIALVRAFQRAGVPYERFDPQTFRRWAFIAHGISLTEHSELGRKPNSAREKLGHQLFHAGVSRARLLWLLNARGLAFTQALSHVLRMMQSKQVAANWVELAMLVLREGTEGRRQKEREESARVKIVTDFIRAESAQAKKS